MLNELDGLGEWDPFDECHKIQTSELGWPTATPEEYTQVTALERLIGSGKVAIEGLETVPMSSVHASCQGVVLRKFVRHYIDHPDQKIVEKHPPCGEYSPLIVELVSGRRIISDGNHRYVAAMLRGDTEFQAFVLRPGSDLSEQTDWAELARPWHRSDK